MSERVLILPLTEHPLTVSGLPDSAVETIARLIHTFRDVGIRYARPAIAAIIAYNDFRWREIEDYVSEYGPKYAAALSEIMAKRVPEDCFVSA